MRPGNLIANSFVTAGIGASISDGRNTIKDNTLIALSGAKTVGLDLLKNVKNYITELENQIKIPSV